MRDLARLADLGNLGSKVAQAVDASIGIRRRSAQGTNILNNAGSKPNEQDTSGTGGPKKPQEFSSKRRSAAQCGKPAKQSRFSSVGGPWRACAWKPP